MHHFWNISIIFMSSIMMTKCKIDICILQSTRYETTILIKKKKQFIYIFDIHKIKMLVFFIAMTFHCWNRMKGVKWQNSNICQKKNQFFAKKKGVNKWNQRKSSSISVNYHRFVFASIEMSLFASSHDFNTSHFLL